ncbi:MAG: putative F420-dependent oxidoreductase [Halieaceae bacterium]|jgi:probable F420-dependent oxidoreductase
MSKPFRFGLQSFNAKSPAEWRERIRKTEDLGYSSFHLADHIIGPGPAIEAAAHPPQLLAAVPAIAMALEMTDTLKVGCRVFCMDYRHPVVLAKEAATMDYLSDGRLELGLGAGWIQSEYDAIGIPFDDFPTRARRFEEVVKSVKAFMAGEPLEIDGEWVKWSDFSGIPVRAKCPPIMIGGGSRGIMRIAGREADIVSFNFNNRTGALGREGALSGFAEETIKKRRWIEEAAGDRFDDIELEIGAYLTIVTDHQQPTVDSVAGMMGLDPESLLASPHTLIGSVDYICDELQRRRETYGISYITVLDDGENNMVEQFAPVVARLAGN